MSLLRRNDSLGDNCFEEVQVIDRNLNYDFDYQQFVHLSREVIVMSVSFDKLVMCDVCSGDLSSPMQPTTPPTPSSPTSPSTLTPASAGSLFCHVFLLASFALVALLFTTM